MAVTGLDRRESMSYLDHQGLRIFPEEM